MKAGELCERVSVQRASVARDGFGAEVLSWATAATVWAKVLERGGNAPVLADRPVMVVSYEVTLRWPLPGGVLPSHKDRLVWRAKTLQIDVVTPDVARGVVVLRCVEVEL